MLRYSRFLVVSLLLVLAIAIIARAGGEKVEIEIFFQLKPSEVTEVSELAGDETEFKVLKLGQAFPNPFNTQTIILVQNPKEQNLSLSVYNLLGQEVITLFENRYLPGRIEAIWDGKEEAGSQISTGGIYLLSLTSEQSGTQTKKLTLIK